MTVRRSVLFVFCALALALFVSCSDGDGGASNGAIDDPRLEQIAKTAEASGTVANAPRSTGTPIPQLEQAGDYEVSFRFQQRPTDEELLDALEMPENLEVVIGEGIIALSEQEPFISLTGTITAEGAISATGNGAIGEAYNDIAATFEGTLVDGLLTGTYTLTGLTLPGSPIVFDVQGEFDD